MKLTIRDIARQCGVGAGTVWRAMNDSGYVREDVKKRIMDFVTEINWKPSKTATALSTGHSGVVGILTSGLQGYIAQNLLETIRMRLEHLNDVPKTMIVNLSAGNSGVEELLREDLEAILLISPPSVTQENIDRLKRSEIPFMGLIGPENDFPTAHSDHYEAAFRGTSELIAAGHRRIGFIGVPRFENPGRHSPSFCRYAVTLGYLDAMAQAGLPADRTRDFIISDASLEDYSRRETDSHRNIEDSLQANRHSAYFIFPWYNTMLFYCVCRDLSITIPHDVSLISLEGEVHREAFNPVPTCFIHNYEQFANYAIEFIRTRGMSPRGQYSVRYKYFQGQSIKKTGESA